MAATLQEVLISFEARIGDAEKNISKITNGLDKTGKKAKEQSSKFKEAGKSANAFYAKLLAGAAAFRAMYNATRDNIQATAKLNAIIKATGGVAGITRGNVKGIVKEIQNYSGATEATVKNSAAMLLTFTNINKKVFPDTLKIASDLSAAFGQDMKSSVIQLGKALNDPAQGYTALQRIGISFSEEQKKQIKYFSSTNQLAKAQAVILNELKREFGGTAAAMNNTPIGEIETAMNGVKDALAKVGAALAPVFRAVGKTVGAIADVIGWLAEKAPAVLAIIGIAIAAAFGPVYAAIAGLIAIISLFSTESLADVEKAIDGIGNSVKKLENEQKAFNKTVDDSIAKLSNLTQGSNAYSAIVEKLIAQYPKLVGYGISVGSSIGEITAAQKMLNEEMKNEQYLNALKKYPEIQEKAESVANKLIEEANKIRKLGADASAEDIANLKKAQFAWLKAKTVMEKVGKAAGKSADEIKNQIDVITTFRKEDFEGNMQEFEVAFNNTAGNVVDIWEHTMRQMTVSELRKEERTLQRQKRELIAFKKQSEEMMRIEAKRTGDRNGLRDFLAWTSSVTSGVAITETDRRIARLRNRIYQLQQRARGNRGGGGDDRNTDKTTGKAATYDYEKAVLEQRMLFEDEYNKKRLKLNAEYAKDVLRIQNATNLSAVEKANALKMAKIKNEKQLADLDKAKRDKEISEAADVAESALSLAGQAASGDVLGALASGLKQFGGPWGKWAAVGISALQGLMSIFKKNTESEIDRIKREFEKIRDTYGQASGVQESLADFLGEATTSGLDSSLRSLMLRVKEIGGILGISLDDALSIDFLSGFGDNLASLIADTETELSDIANGVSGMTAASEEEALALIEEYPQFAEQIQDSIRAAKQGNGPFSFGFLGQLRFELIEYNKLLNAQKEIYSEILDITGDIQDKEAQRAILKAQADLKDIQDDIRTGRREEADTLAEQIALYDDMISALDGVAGATDLINDLLEQRLALQQKLNGETDISAYQAGAQGASLSSLVAELDKLNRDIETGAVRGGTAETVQRQVGLIDAIIANLQGQGASAEVIQGFATQKADILKGFYGEQGFAARAGSGAAVGFSAPASSTVTSNNTTTNNNVNISGQQFNDDFFSWMADEFSRRYGVNILAGA